MSFFIPSSRSRRPGGCLKHLAQRVGIVRLDGIFDLIQLRFKTPNGRQQVFLVAQKQLAP